MNLSPFRRVVSLALTLWIALFMSASEWVVACPTHGGGSVTASHGQPAGGGVPVAVDSDVATHDHGTGHSIPAQDDESHSCSCAGPSCCPPGVATLAAVELPLAHVVAVHEATAVSTLDLFPEASDHLHPPATAPPAVALAPVT